MPRIAAQRKRLLSDEDFVTLAAFRHGLRRFLAFSEAAARAAGITPQQHQAILAIRAHRNGAPLTIGELADHLLIRHHSAVELVDRLVRARLAVRSHGGEDRRAALISLTAKADTVLEQLSSAHLAELRHGRAVLIRLLKRLD